MQSPIVTGKQPYRDWETEQVRLLKQLDKLKKEIETLTGVGSFWIGESIPAF